MVASDSQSATRHTLTPTGMKIGQAVLKFRTAFGTRSTEIYQVAFADFCRKQIIEKVLPIFNGQIFIEELIIIDF